MRNAFVMLVLLVGLAGWIVTVPAVSAAPSTVTVNESSDGKTITVKQSTLVKVTLDGNITTGYGWDVESVGGSAAKQDGKPQYKDSPGNGLGRPGTFTLTFKTPAVGTSVVKLKYSRPWEKNKPPAKTYSITIKVVP